MSFLYQRVMQLLRMFFIVPLQQVRIGDGPSQKVGMLLGFLDHEAGDGGPGKVICQVSTKEFSALDYLDR